MICVFTQKVVILFVYYSKIYIVHKSVVNSGILILTDIRKDDKLEV